MNIHGLLQEVLYQMGGSGNVDFSPMGGGDTAISGEITVKGDKKFVKIHESAPMIIAEAASLAALSSFVRVPRVEYAGEVQGAGVLIMERMTLHRPSSRQDWERLGESLAHLHQASRQDHGYGLLEDNFIGGSPQHNGTLGSWQRFFVAHRLGPQLAWAEQRGLAADSRDRIKEVIASIDQWLPDCPPSSLVHGDLWAGNLGLEGDVPVFFDPACYYGDPQVDLAMMALFGQVPEAFYLAYQGGLPDRDQQRRWRVYDLYHLLNHFNLFGAGYGDAAARLAEQLLRA